MFAALASNEDKILEMVNVFIALAPVARMNGASESLKLICENMDIVDETAEQLDIHELFGLQAASEYH